jgi:hypothetical protein
MQLHACTALVYQGTSAGDGLPHAVSAGCCCSACSRQLHAQVQWWIMPAGEAFHASWLNSAACAAVACVQGRGWTISPIPYAVGETQPLDEDAVRVDLQLMLPTITSRKSSKALPAAAAACAADSCDSDSSYGSSCSSFGSQAGDSGEPAPTCGDAVVLQVRPEAAAASSQQAAAPAALVQHSSQASALMTTAAAGAAAAATAAAAGSDDGDDEGLCTICYDQPATCVLMECGHGGYCWRCAHLLFARPPSECPVCRQSIMQVGRGLC